MDPALFSAPLVRTEAGRAEIRTAAHALSRSARNLLMVIDASRSGAEWVARVQGSSTADLAQLLEAGLVAPSGAAAEAGPAAAPRVTVETAVQTWAYDPLYKLLTHEARERFGLIKGYRLVLRIEGCANLGELQKVALDFVALIRQAHGEEPAARFRRLLGASD